MSPDDPRHGLPRGWSAGCREECCREARNRDERTRRKYRVVYGQRRSIPAIGTTRRIHALMRIGWPSHVIAAHCGWTTGQAVLEVANRTWVERGTAAKIAEVYETLSMQLGPSIETRARAERKGWAPPLAWEAIDDPDDTPAGAYVEPTRAEMLTDLHENGAGITEACRALQLSRDSLQKWCGNNGLSHIYRDLTGRESHTRNQYASEVA